MRDTVPVTEPLFTMRFAAVMESTGSLNVIVMGIGRVPTLVVEEVILVISGRTKSIHACIKMYLPLFFTHNISIQYG